MNKLKRKTTVRLFSVNAYLNFFDDFVSIHKANQSCEKKARIVNVREKKHLLKIHEELQWGGAPVYFLSVVRERVSWQVRALNDGTISGIPLNQGIMGDPYYFLVQPKNKIILGFTTGSTGTLKSTATIALQQFVKDRTEKIVLQPVSNDREVARLRELSGYNKLYFKVDMASLGEVDEGAPGILKQLSAVSAVTGNSELALTLPEIGGTGFSEDDLVEIVSFLSESEACSALTVHGIDAEGVRVHLDFSRTYAIYRTEIEVRDKFVDEVCAKKILQDAILHFQASTLLSS